MSFITVLATLALAVPQSAPQTSSGFTFAGTNVPLRYPEADSRQAPEGFLDWHGWTYKSGTLMLTNGTFPAVDDWAAIRGAADGAKSVKDPAKWRERIVVFTRTVLIDHLADGTIRQRRGFMKDAELQEALQDVARSTVVAAARTKGQVELVPDVSVETEPMIEEIVDGKRPYGAEFAQRYLEPRVNGGTYEAEDKVYRGPYDGIVLVLPQSTADTAPIDTTVHGMPVRIIALDAPVAVSGVLETALDQAFWAQASARAAGLGYRAGSTGANLSPSVLASFSEPSAEEIAKRSAETYRVAPEAPEPATLYTTSWKGQNTDVALVQDPDRGQVLHLTMQAGQRAGGIELPSPEGGFGVKGSTFRFFARSKSTDPIAIRILRESGESIWYSLGRELPAPSEASIPAALPTSFTPDGTWQQIAIDLKSVGPIARITIEPSLRSRFEERRYVFPIEFDFDAFEFTNDPVTTVQEPVDPDMAPALSAADAFRSGTASAELAGLLASPSAFVQLNALRAYTKIKDPTVEASLEAAAKSLDPAIQIYALRALANQGTDASTAALRKVLVLGTTELARGIAAELLADNPPANLSAELGLLVPLETWQGRVRAVNALAKLKGNAPGITMMTFIFHDDPAVKLAVTKSADPSNEFQMRRVEWSAVNEPWDAVRMWSDTKLVQSKVDEFRTQGYKGVRDDSVAVRLEFVRWLGEHPDAAHLPSLKLALSDASYRVRAAALGALEKQPGDIKAEELQPLFADKYPTVQLALIELAKAKALKLPDETLAQMKSSPFKEVADAASGLG